MEVGGGGKAGLEEKYSLALRRDVSEKCRKTILENDVDRSSSTDRGSRISSTGATVNSSLKGAER